jgi:hypothetical protein
VLTLCYGDDLDQVGRIQPLIQEKVNQQQPEGSKRKGDKEDRSVLEAVIENDKLL